MTKGGWAGGETSVLLSALSHLRNFKAFLRLSRKPSLFFLSDFFFQPVNEIFEQYDYWVIKFKFE